MPANHAGVLQHVQCHVRSLTVRQLKLMMLPQLFGCQPTISLHGNTILAMQELAWPGLTAFTVCLADQVEYDCQVGTCHITCQAAKHCVQGQYDQTYTS